MIPLRCLVAFLLAAAPSQEGGTTHAFVDVHVVPMDAERVLEHQTVVVRGGRIVAMGGVADVAVPAAAVRIEGGGWLMPGLAEMHGHLPLRSPFLPARWSEDVLFLYVANGITTVRGMQGREPHLEMRRRIAAGELLGPRIFVASPPLHGRGEGMDDPERAAERVRGHAKAGYDLLKVHEGLRPEVYEAITTTAREIGIRYAGHVPDQVGFFRAVGSGQLTVDHLDGMFDAVGGDRARIPELVDALRDHGAWVVPTEVLWETAFLTPDDPEEVQRVRHELRYAPRALVARWAGSLARRRQAGFDAEAGEARTAFRHALIAAVQEAGAGLLLGTDSPQIFSVPGFSLHREMAVMVEAGLTPYQVLASGTRRVAEYFGTGATTGTVAVGKRADLVLLEENPLDNVAHVADPRGVMVAGRWLPAETIRERLEAIAAAYGQ